MTSLDRRQFVIGAATASTFTMTTGTAALAANSASHSIVVTAKDLPKRSPHPAAKWLRDLLKAIILGKVKAPDDFVETLKALEAEHADVFEKGIAGGAGDIVEIGDDIEPKRKITIKISIKLGKPPEFAIEISF